MQARVAHKSLLPPPHQDWWRDLLAEGCVDVTPLAASQEEEEEEQEGEVARVILVCHMAAPVHQRTVEAVGAAYERLVRQIMGIAEVQEQEDTSAARTHGAGPSRAGKDRDKDRDNFAATDEGQSKWRPDPDANEPDFYETLGLGHLRWRATKGEIRKAYLKVVVTAHPDKIQEAKQGAAAAASNTEEGGEGAESSQQSAVAQGSEDIDDSHFKQVKRAFEILSHPPSRRAFDSQDEFDDTVPEIGFGRLKDDAEFYAVFGDCFDRNARWASCHYSDVPKFGDETASDREVQDFYDFWFGFPSWRSFPEAMEHDPEKAECREERRWMERENARAINKKRRKEAARIRRIVDNAHSRDPRVRRMQEKLREERREERRNRKRQQSSVFEQMAEEQRKKLEQDRVKEEEEGEKKKDEQRAAQARKREVAQRRKAFMSTVMIPEVARTLLTGDIEMITMNLSTEDLEEYQEQIRPLVASPSRLLDELRHKIHAIKISIGKSSTPPVSSSAPAEGASSSSSSSSSGPALSDWSPGDLAKLAEGIAKFPGGTANRWKRIADFLGGGRSVKEIVSMAKMVEEKTRAGEVLSLDSSKAFEESQRSRESHMSKKALSSEVVEKPKSSTRSPGSVAASSSASTSSQPAAPPAASASGNGLEGGDWSREEQRALEQGLKQFPAADKQRFIKIAEMVGTKDPRQCFDRFRAIVAHLKRKKEAGQ